MLLVTSDWQLDWANVACIRWLCNIHTLYINKPIIIVNFTATCGSQSIAGHHLLEGSIA